MYRSNIHTSIPNRARISGPRDSFGISLPVWSVDILNFDSFLQLLWVFLDLGRMSIYTHTGLDRV